MQLRTVVSTLLSIFFIAACGSDDPGSEREREGPRLEMTDEISLVAEDAENIEGLFTVQNTGGELLDVAFSHHEEWLDIEPSESTVEPESKREIVVRGDCGVLDDETTTVSTEVTVETNDEGADDPTLTVLLDCEEIYAVETGELHVHADIPDSGEIEFFVEEIDGTEVHSFSADSPTVETIDLEPGTYLVTIEDSVVDQWGNVFVFDGLDETFEVEVDTEYIHTVSTQLPTEVTTETDDADVYGSLREVVERVHPESVITFDESVQKIVVDAPVEIDKPLSIVGDGEPEETIITESTGDLEELMTIDVSGGLDGEVSIRQIRFADADLEGVALAHYGDVDLTLFETEFVNISAESTQAMETGAAVAIRELGEELEVRIQNSRFVDNSSAFFSGAISVWDTNETDSSVVVEDSEFEENVVVGGLGGSGMGGAIGILSDTDVSIKESLFVDNGGLTDVRGGAIYTRGSLELSRTTFDNNEAFKGGAIELSDEEGSVSSRIRHSYFVNNTAHEGGAVYASQDENRNRVHLDGVLFEDNSGNEHGGAIYLDDAGIDAMNSTFSKNSATLGGAILMDEGASARIRYNTFIDNTADYGEAVYAAGEAFSPILRANYVTDGIEAGVGNEFSSRGYNLFSSSDVENQFGTTSSTDLFGAYTAYSSLSDNGGYTDTYAIDPVSEGYRDIPADDCRRRDYAFDVIPPDYQQPLHIADQRGEPRPGGNRCTRGAWEAETYVETFEDAGLSDQFESGSFDGLGGRTWEYTDVRHEGDYGVPYSMEDSHPEAELPGARFMDEGATIGTSDFDGVDGDLESVSIVFRAAGGETGDRLLEVRADGDQIDDSKIFGDDDDEFGFPPTVHVLEIDDPSLGSDVEFEIRNASPGGEGDIVIDRITWR